MALSKTRKRWHKFSKSDSFRRFKLALKRLAGREPRFKLDLQVRLEQMGGWRLCADLVSEGQVVYSLGVGENIDFDLELISAKGVDVFAFDPTPNSVDWLNTQVLPAQFNFHPWAISDRDGTLYLYPRIRHDGSRSREMFTIMAEPSAREDAVEVPSRTLSSIMETLGHDRIDVLKMDIEGAEYGVLGGLLASAIRPRQLLIEFHHRFAGLGVPKTLDAVARLRGAGYGLVYISSTGRDFTFILRSAPGA